MVLESTLSGLIQLVAQEMLPDPPVFRQISQLIFGRILLGMSSAPLRVQRKQTRQPPTNWDELENKISNC